MKTREYKCIIDNRLFWGLIIIMVMFLCGTLIVDTLGIGGPPQCPPCYEWNGHSCELPEWCICCYGTCCESYLCEGCGDDAVVPCKVCGGDPKKCCIDEQCIDPICDNCHMFNDTLYECYHESQDDECLVNKCIMNVMSTATCDWKGYDWPCPKCDCQAVPDFWEDPMVIQYEIEDVVCLSTSDWELWTTLWTGCVVCGPDDQWIRCETNVAGCVGVPIKPRTIGIRNVCGNCNE